MSALESRRAQRGRKIRIGIFCSVMSLVSVGIVMIYSASAVYADQRYGDSMFFLKRHLIFLGLGMAVFLVMMLLDPERLRRNATGMLLVVGLALIWVAFFAPAIGGARRWIPLGGMNVQPSEFAKFALIVFLAKRLSGPNKSFVHFKKDVLPELLVIALVAGLIFAGRDFGTTVVIGSVSMVMLFAARLPLRYFAMTLGAALPLLGAAVILEPYRIKRVVAFLNPFQDVRDTSFQLYQSLLAIGSGGFTGVGLGRSQQKLFYLPAAHTDFIFSIIGEEMGFVGASL
ncbi:MAG: cell division protein FtsW, partial [Candidatus Omnitrophica bacterium]|nr:cell division protein FtsW [Candidatus Omnitrophota bacterium]